MERRYTFGNDFPSRMGNMDMDTDSMMKDDLSRIRDRFHERAQRNSINRDPEFDRWFDQGNDAFNARPFKIPKEDERSAYVRNIPIFQEVNGASSQTNQNRREPNHGSDENLLLHQSKSSIPRPVPPQKSTSPTPPTTNYTAPPTLPKPKMPVRVMPSNGSDSGIERPESKSPSDTTDTSSNFGTMPRNLRAGSVGRGGLFEKERKIPVKVEAVPPTPAKSEAIPMGYTKIRDPNEPIPMGFDRSASAPNDNQTSSPKFDRKSDLPKAPRPAATKDVGGVHRVPIVVKNVDGPRSASAPPKPTETSPPPPSQSPPTVKSMGPLEKIADILNGVKDLEARIAAFQGTRGEHEYKLLDELLTQAVIKLDSVQTDGVEEVRNARKEAVKRVHELSAQLEAKGVVGDRPKSKSPPGGGATTRIVIPMGPDAKVGDLEGEKKKL